MPAYNANQFGSKAILSEQGWPVYLLGSRNPLVYKGFVTNVALTSIVETVTVTAWEGPTPAVGDLITLTQTQNTSGLFNVQNATITAVALDADGGGTMSFALTHANVVSAADAGTAYVTKQVVGETLVAGASIAATSSRARGEFGVNIFVDVQFPTVPTAVTVKIQTAMRDIDSDYADAATVATVSGSAVTLKQYNLSTTAPFFRLSVSGLTGSGTIAATVTT